MNKAGIIFISVAAAMSLISCDSKTGTSVTIIGGADDSRAAEISEAINQWQSQFDEDDYPGYIDVSLAENSVFVYLDLGSIEDCDRSIYGIVEAFKNVQGIREVIVNESMEGMEGMN